MIKGNIVALRPATQDNKRTVYEWLIQWSDLTLNQHKPSWEEFCNDYKDFFFDDTQQNVGRCFLIIVGETPIGHINYHTLYPHYKHTELDIWMSNDKCCGRGYGSDALNALCNYLFQQFGIDEFVIRPWKKNKRAIRAYQKAGFQKIDCTLEEQILRYSAPDAKDCIVMIKRITV